MTGLPFGARLTFGQARMMNSIIQIFPLVSKVGLIAATKPAIGTASLGKAMVTTAWPHLAAMGKACGLWRVTVFIHVLDRRLTAFAAIMSNGAGTRMIPILRSHNGQQLMSATIANIVSLNSFHSGFIRDE
jgi:hypothetical protein